MSPWLFKRISEVDEGKEMERRLLGGTGISVSWFALGTMMMGAMGNTDHDESVRMLYAALDSGNNFISV
jgi:aryl-alcohol dehydrogenase-like predicted oxidoreductase